MESFRDNTSKVRDFGKQFKQEIQDNGLSAICYNIQNAWES